MNEITSKKVLEEEETVRESENSIEQIARLILLLATHETGHYIVTRVLVNYRKSTSIEILSEDEKQYLGAHKSTESANVQKQKEDYLNEIAVLLAGTVAEKMFLTKEFITSINIIDVENGNNDDLEKALKLANKIAPEYCCKSRKMCKACNKWSKHLKKHFLEAARNRVLKEAEMLARRTILKHKKQFEEVQNELIRKRELTGEELEKLYNQK